MRSETATASAPRSCASRSGSPRVASRPPTCACCIHVCYGIMPPAVQDPSRTQPDRYEPLPGFAGLPRWLWRKIPPAGRVAVGLFPLVAVAVALLLAPGIDESKDKRARAESERLARL